MTENDTFEIEADDKVELLIMEFPNGVPQGLKVVEPKDNFITSETIIGEVAVKISHSKKLLVPEKARVIKAVREMDNFEKGKDED